MPKIIYNVAINFALDDKNISERRIIHYFNDQIIFQNIKKELIIQTVPILQPYMKQFLKQRNDGENTIFIDKQRTFIEKKIKDFIVNILVKEEYKFLFHNKILKVNIVESFGKKYQEHQAKAKEAKEAATKNQEAKTAEAKADMIKIEKEISNLSKDFLIWIQELFEILTEKEKKLFYENSERCLDINSDQQFQAFQSTDKLLIYEQNKKIHLISLINNKDFDFSNSQQKILKTIYNEKIILNSLKIVNLRKINIAHLQTLQQYTEDILTTQVSVEILKLIEILVSSNLNKANFEEQKRILLNLIIKKTILNIPELKDDENQMIDKLFFVITSENSEIENIDIYKKIMVYLGEQTKENLDKTSLTNEDVEKLLISKYKNCVKYNKDNSEKQFEFKEEFNCNYLTDINVVNTQFSLYNIFVNFLVLIYYLQLNNQLMIVPKYLDILTNV